MIAYTLSNLPNDNYSMKPERHLSDMHESTLDLFCGDDLSPDEDNNIALAYAETIEQRAAELEVTVDYYMAEFM
jgi:hypothetical protein